MIWIIGEYAERIDNADELLESFLEGFHDENSQVQLQLLTAIVKLFLKRPSDTQELVQQVGPLGRGGVRAGQGAVSGQGRDLGQQGDRLGQQVAMGVLISGVVKPQS